jgi:hypothetical protein
MVSLEMMISLSMQGRDLGMIVGSAGFFCLHMTVVKGFSLCSAAAAMHAAQVRSSVVGLCGCGAAGVCAC